jgi:hypothetical protein
MSGQKENRHLIDHFSSVKPLPRHRITRGHDLGRQIIGRSARRNGRLPRRGQIGDQTADPPCRIAGIARKPARDETWQRQERRDVQDRLAFLIAAKFMCRTSTTLSARDNHLGRFSGR